MHLSFPTRFGTFNTTAQRVTIDREENFIQATERYNSFDTDRKYRFQMRLVEAFSDNRISDNIRNKLMTYWRAVHTDLGEVVRTLRPTITPTPANEPATNAPVQAPQVDEKADQSVAVALLTVFLVLVSVALVISVAMNIVHRNIIAKSHNANRERLLYDTTKNDLW